MVATINQILLFSSVLIARDWNRNGFRAHVIFIEFVIMFLFKSTCDFDDLKAPQRFIDLTNQTEIVQDFNMLLIKFTIYIPSRWHVRFYVQEIPQ